jgi:hypothetical protein
MAQRTGRRSRVSIVEAGQTTAYVAPLSGEENIGSDSAHVPVPLYRGVGEVMDQLLGLATANGNAPVNLDTHWFPRFVTLLWGRDGYEVTPIGTLYRHRWPIGDGLNCHLQKDSLKPTVETFVVKNCKPGGFAMTGAVTGPAIYNPSFMGTGEEDSVQIDATPTLDPFTALSNLHGQIALNDVVLGAVVTNFSQTYSQDLSRTDAYFSEFAAGIIEGDPTDSGQLDMTYENRADYYDLAASETRVGLDCIYANKKMVNNPTQWVRFLRPAILLSKGMPRMGGKLGLQVKQAFATVPYDDSGNQGTHGEIMSAVGPFNITATDVDFQFKIDGGTTIMKTLTIGAARTALQIVADIGSFAGGYAIAVGGRVVVRSTSKGPTSSVLMVNAGANSAHDVLGMTIAARIGMAASLVIEVVNDVASYATW